jgi:hypothetical protein
MTDMPAMASDVNTAELDWLRDQKFESGSLQQRDGMGQAAKEMAPSSLANN